MSDTYDGPVCYQDGWHWTVVPDEAGRTHAVAIVTANLEYARAKLGPDEVAAAEEALTEVEAREWSQPGERLFLEDDGSSYRLAVDGDQSWHDRHHRQYKLATFNNNVEH